MRKKLVSLVVAAAAVTSALGGITAGASPIHGFPHVYDFEDSAAGTKFSTDSGIWSGYISDGNRGVIANNGDFRGNVLKLHEASWPINIQSNWFQSGSGAFFKNDDTVLYSYAIKPGTSSRANSCSLVYKRSSDVWASISKIAADTDNPSDKSKFTLSIFDWSENDKRTEVTQDSWRKLDTAKWYYIDYKIDFKNSIYDVCLLDGDGNMLGSPIEANFRHQSGDKYTNSPRLQTSSAGDKIYDDSYYYYDNFTTAVYNSDGAQVIKSNSTDEALVSDNGAILTLKLDQSYDKTNNFNDKSKITIKSSNGDEFTDFEMAESDFGSVKIKLNSPLNPKETYTVSFDKSLKTVFNQSVSDYTFTTPMRVLPKVEFSVKDNYTDKISVSDEKSTIAVLETVTPEELCEAIDTSADVIIYKDSSLSQTAEKLTDSCVLVLTDGKGYSKYSISLRPQCGYVVKEFNTYLNGGKVESEFTNGSISANASLICYRPNIALDIVLAAYDKSGRLTSVQKNHAVFTNDTADFLNGTELTKSVQKTVSSSDETIKAFLLSGTGALSPICKNISLTAAPKGEITSCRGVYPGYTNKAITLSFDDGLVKDEEFIAMLDKYGAKATFNLISDMNILKNADAAQKAHVKEVYKNHEIGNHVKGHPQFKDDPNATSSTLVSSVDEYIKLINEGRSELEEIAGYSVRGIAWPNGKPPKKLPSEDNSYWKQIQAYIQTTDTAYTRSDANSLSFDVPQSWFDWNPTCHYTGIDSLKGQFFNDTSDELRLFSVWGHSYEFDMANKKPMSTVENLIKAAKEKNIWCPTNIELVDYVNALRKSSYDSETITNNSDIDLYFIVNSMPITVKANSTYTFYDGTTAPTIFLASDSICENITTETRKGWGMYFANYLDSAVTVSNHAKHGRSTKTFLNEGRFDGIKDLNGPYTGDGQFPASGHNILNEAKSGDYVFIQFGHNDGDNVNNRGTYNNKPELKTRQSYHYNLETMVTQARSKGLIPVILTSVSTPYAKESGDRSQGWTESYIERWRKAAREEAAALDVPLLDIGALHKEYLNTLTAEEGAALFVSDGLHPTAEGANIIAEIVANAIKSNPELSELAYYVK